MLAYNAAKTLQKTYDEVMEQGIVDLVIIVDDGSHDDTSAIASIASPVPKCLSKNGTKVTVATRRPRPSVCH